MLFTVTIKINLSLEECDVAIAKKKNDEWKRSRSRQDLVDCIHCISVVEDFPRQDVYALVNVAVIVA